MEAKHLRANLVQLVDKGAAIPFLKMKHTNGGIINITKVISLFQKD